MLPSGTPKQNHQVFQKALSFAAKSLLLLLQHKIIIPIRANAERARTRHALFLAFNVLD